MTWRVFSSKMYPGEWREKSKLLLDVLINHLWSRDPSDVPWEAILEGSRGMVWYFVNHWDANSTAVIRKCKGLGQRVPEGSCEAPELILLPWMWGQWASATVAHGTVLAELVTSHPHSKLKMTSRASLVAQWLRICLPVQGTRVRALVWEDPTCCGATGPVSHNYWACASGACAPQQERPW